MYPFRSHDLAVDVGTATIRAATLTGRVCEHRSLSKNIHALSRGVIANRAATVEILKPLLRRSNPSRLSRPRVLTCAPTDATTHELGLLRDCLLKAGASAVVIVPEPLAAAVGAKIDIASGYAKLLIDVGEGVTDCALIQSGRVVQSVAVRIGCADLRQSVRTWADEALNLALTDADAGQLLRQVGFGAEPACLYTACPTQLTVELVRRSVQPSLSAILETLNSMIDELSAPFGAEVIEDGIFITGGGALLPGMSEAITASTGIHSTVVANPLAAVILGARAMLPLAAALNLWEG